MCLFLGDISIFYPPIMTMFYHLSLLLPTLLSCQETLSLPLLPPLLKFPFVPQPIVLFLSLYFSFLFVSKSNSFGRTANNYWRAEVLQKKRRKEETLSNTIVVVICMPPFLSLFSLSSFCLSACVQMPS